MNSVEHANALNRFYGILDRLEQTCGGCRVLETCDGRSQWPARGVYFFFETDELRTNDRRRVVRVGTHALTSSSRTTLWDRLSQHRGQLNGRWAGGGNHRGSVFRLHVGEALINRGGWSDEVAESWKRSRKQVIAGARDIEYPLEQAVSAVIGAMPLIWVAVDDEPGPESERGLIEAGAISLLSNERRPGDSPTAAWLGLHAARASIRESGLWNVRHIDDVASAAFLDVLEECVNAMER